MGQLTLVRERTPTPEPGSDTDHESDGGDLYKLRPPQSPIPSPQIPPAPPVQSTRVDQTDAPPTVLLLSNQRWWSANEERYSKSLTILKDMFDK